MVYFSRMKPLLVKFCVLYNLCYCCDAEISTALAFSLGLRNWRQTAKFIKLKSLFFGISICSLGVIEVIV